MTKIYTLQCPKCHSNLEKLKDEFICSSKECKYHNISFPIIHNVPCIIDFDNSVIHNQELIKVDLKKVATKTKFLHRIANYSEGKPLATQDAGKHFIENLEKERKKSKVLIIGGGTIGVGSDALHASDSIELTVTDIYISDITDLVCDGHSLPFQNGSFDGVWIQAVLEHVLDPIIVVSEIHRVLKPDGIVYSGIPFMQQVHMGAYDFQRYTKSGHRWLFKNFQEIKSGITNGAGRVLMWTTFHFLRSLFRTDKFWIPLRISMGWLSRFERFLDHAKNADTASGTYFIGKKSENKLLPSQIIDYYENQ